MQKIKEEYTSLRNTVFVLIGVVILPVLLSSEESIGAKIEIKPMITASAEYDSNFYRTEGNERAVDTYTVKPGVRLGTSTERSSLFVSYKLEAFWYNDRDSVPEGERKASNSDYLGHLFVLDGAYDATDRLTVGLKDDFTISQVPTESDRLAPRVDRETYLVNTLRPWISYDFSPKWFAMLDYHWNIVDYEERDFDDSQAHGPRFKLTYRPSRTLTLDFVYDYFNRKWSDDREYNSNRARLGFEKLYNYLSFGGWAGYHDRSYDDPTPSEDARLGSDSTVPFAGYITWQNPSRAMGTSGFGDGFLLANSYANLSGGRDYPNLTFFRDNYTYDYIMLVLGASVWNQRIPLYLKGEYGVRDFERWTGLNTSGQEVIRRDDLYEIRAGIGYWITKKKQWLLSFSLGRETQDSNLVGFNWDNDYAMLKLRWNYDLASRGIFRNLGDYIYR